MNAIELKRYPPTLPDIKEPTYGQIAVAPLQVIRDSFLLLKANLTNDPEAGVELMGKIASTIDICLNWVNTPIQLLTTSEPFFREVFNTHVPWSQWSPWLKALTLPFGAIFLILSVIESVYESINLSRACKLSLSLSPANWSDEKAVLKDLKMIQADFFELTSEETQKLQDFFKQAGQSNINVEKKFHEIRDKALSVRYEQLVRRVAPWLAKEIKETLPQIIADLETGDLSIKEAAHLKGRVLLENINCQANKKILIHAIALIAIAIFVLSMIVVFAGLQMTPVIIAFSAIGIVLSISRLLIERGLINQPGWNFSAYDCLPDFLK